MQSDLIQKARAGRTKALKLRQSKGAIEDRSGKACRFPELKLKEVVALFDTTQRHFGRNMSKRELKTA